MAETIAQRLRRLPEDEITERQALNRLAELTAQAKSSAKYDALVSHLREIGVAAGSPRRAVVFAERVSTLNWLTERLYKDLKLAKDQVAVMHGGLSDTEQQEVVESFKLESSPIRVLVTGDIASEGVNLHSQCHHLVHYDIPWSLIRIEQRNGRIDRYGQRNRPEITALLLTPSTERFSGDIRVLTRLVEREHEAHTALGDAASLIGTYDVKAEEDAVRQVLEGTAELDAVVRSVQEVTASGGLDAFFASLALGATEPTEPAPQAAPNLYAADFDFLADAVAEFVTTPHLDPPNGIKWQVHKQHSIVGLTPPKDLKQRLQVLPQSYLRDRRITETYKLAVTAGRGRDELAAARTGDSKTAWPEAHFLAPLHPVLEWASDRALAELSRDEIFVARGTVDDPTVLVSVMQSNRRGQVVASSYYTVQFPDPALPLTSAHQSAGDALMALGLSDVNAGDLGDVSRLQPLVAAAVIAADSAAEHHAQAIRDETRQRINDWIARTVTWKQLAVNMTQHTGLRQRARRIDDEQALAEEMNPDRRLVRPLIVIVPGQESTS